MGHETNLSLAHTHFAANVFSLPMKTDKNPRGVVTEHELYSVLAVIFVSVFFDFDPASSYPLHQAAKAATSSIGALVEQNVKATSSTSFLSSFMDPLLQRGDGDGKANGKGINALGDYGVHMIRRLLDSGLGTHEIAWSQVLPTAVAMVANQAQVVSQTLSGV
jgi:linoleate 10R-lipoxygenase